jgi:HD-GYP domain-containing protein (c-di-GMP phosphodiesterase class II)
MDAIQADTGNGANPHYLDHVMAVSTTLAVEASEDIYAGNGMKLLARGARVDARVRDRLLEHKLHKPLEECVEVIGGVIPARFGPIAEQLAEQHPLLGTLCAQQRGLPVPVALSTLSMSMPMQSLLTVYASYKEDRLQHTVGVAMLALALARKLHPGDVDAHRTLALAGLVHDVGELYIDPAYLRRDAPLRPEQWRHIVTHPLVGHRVLRDMVGAGAAVADAVLNHHERLDGFGYPYGVRNRELPLNGQILAVAEWLMALIESDRTPLSHARLAAALMPGEFNRAILEILAAAARTSDEVVSTAALPLPLEEAIPRAQRIADTLRRFRDLRPWIDERIAGADTGLKHLLEIGLVRMQRVQTAFSSTGLDAGDPDRLLRELAALLDPQVHIEVVTVVRELGWRLRELEREQLLRASVLSASDQSVIRELIDRLKGCAPCDAARPS